MSLRMPGSSAPNGSSSSKHARLHHQRLRDRETLLHAARQLLRIFVQRRAEADVFQHRHGLVTRRAPSRTEQSARELRVRQFEPEHHIAHHLRWSNTE